MRTSEWFSGVWRRISKPGIRQRNSDLARGRVLLGSNQRRLARDQNLGGLHRGLGRCTSEAIHDELYIEWVICRVLTRLGSLPGSRGAPSPGQVNLIDQTNNDETLSYPETLARTILDIRP